MKKLKTILIFITFLSALFLTACHNDFCPTFKIKGSARVVNVSK
ncbi:MAG TPA: hypothetical protein P5050_03295 [Bacteroidia bacterium]|nr:hypothetical protein [Bacteroidia bacterium]HRS58225.1 hypothetical protein [Bacteroidia bacterium]HRU68654.1 hypothetical protein [Bacteroidia bacterium]